MSRANRCVAAAVGAAALLALWWEITPDDPHPARPATLAAATPPGGSPLRVVGAALSAGPAASGSRDAAGFERWLTEQSSLRGSVLDGAWDVDLQGELHPTIALRRRFDQLLSLLGEASIEEITAYIARDVQDLAGPAAAQRVLDLWQRYLGLQRQAYRSQIDLHDRDSWARALSERQQARRQWLGPEVAAAFFADDEAQVQALMRGDPVRDVGGPGGLRIDRARLGAPALERLRRQEAAWAGWERRLADAQREWAALQARSELSEVQRAAAIEQSIARHFDAHEALRVRALLRLPPSGPSPGQSPG